MSTADARHDATETIVGGEPSLVIHDQAISTGEARLAAELGVTRWLGAGLIVPLRLYHTSIRYLDPTGGRVQIENASVHHRNDTLTGIGDPWLFGRVAHRLAGFTVGGRAGLTLPLGRTEPDPFRLGDLGIAHEHSQFGTGSVGAIAGLDAARVIGGVRVDASVLTIQSFYANGEGYEAGDRYAVALGAASDLGTRAWRFRATVESIWETAERWGGVVHTDDGNVGRVDVLAGAEVTWRATPAWHVGLSVKLPAYSDIEGGQLDAAGFFGLNVGARFDVFGAKAKAPDDHAHDHAHDHGAGDAHDHADHGTAEAAPVDWTGLDKADPGTDGRVVPLTPVLGKITVYDFWATWCAPCGVVDRGLAALARRFPADLAIRKIDVVDADSPASQAYLAGSTLPHLKVFGRDGKLLWERSAPPAALVGAVEQAITGPRAAAPGARRIAIEVTEAGFVPARIEIERGRPVILVFTRKATRTCATDVHLALPDGTRRAEPLPLDTPVELALAPDRAGEIAFACGMNMVRGAIIVK